MVSLIVGTLGRNSELALLLDSLERQSYKDFEVVVVDQNDDDRVPRILQAHKQLKMLYLWSERGLCRARNLGLQHVTGDIIAIPDDDCWYPDALLASVVAWFDAHSEFSGLSTMKRAADNTPVGLKWPVAPQEISRANVFECAMSSTIFLRRSVILHVGQFNEDIGVGALSKYQSGEETDYLLRVIAMGFRLWYEPRFIVHHPPLSGIERLRKTTYPFALGAGYVMRAHGYSWKYLAMRVIRSVGGALLSVCRGDLPRGRMYLQRAMGQWHGYVFGPRELARPRSNGA